MKYLGIILIVIGASDLILWAISGFKSGWFEYVIGVNVVSVYGAWILIAIGGWLVGKYGFSGKRNSKTG